MAETVLVTFPEDIRRPFNLVSLTLAVLGVAVSIYLYNNPRVERRISYTRAQLSKIFDSKSLTTNLRVTDAQGSPVSSDVSVLSFTIWNSGTQPLEPVDVRRPLQIVNHSVSRILDASIGRRNDAGVANFALQPDLKPEEGRDRAVVLSWTHFDPGHGLEVQIVYAGNESAQVDIAAEIVGVSEVNKALVLGSGKWLFAAIVFACVFAIIYFVRQIVAMNLSPIGLFLGDKAYAQLASNETVLAQIAADKKMQSLHRSVKGFIYGVIGALIVAIGICAWILLQDKAAPF